MVDLKNCPFCGGSTFTRYTVDTRHLNSVVTWHHIRCDAPACAAEMRYPSEEGVIAAWNRRALQAVGPEPAAAGFAETLNFYISEAEDGICRVPRQKLVEIRTALRSALVATPPAVPGVEALRELETALLSADPYRHIRAAKTALATKPAVKDETVKHRRYALEWTAAPRPPVHPRPMEGQASFPTFDDAVAFMARQAPDSEFRSLTEYATVSEEFDRTSDARAALAAKPAIKDDEKVVEALPLREIRRRVRNIWGAISSNQVIDKDVEGQAKRLLADIDAALTAKEGRS